MPADTPPPADDPRSDQQLVAAANAGDPAAFDALYHRYKKWVVSLATRLTGDPEQAMDVLQETFIYLLSKFPGFRLTSRLTTFLYPAVKNISIGFRRKTLKFMGGDQAFDYMPAPAPAQPHELTTVIASLPQAQQEVVLMRFVDGLSLEEIAIALKIPLGTVKSRLHNALAALRADPRVQRFYEP
ncbi:MAG TPA: sigma-70 family RNA polymerase sigma factor [Tepidisphaeraceae bacterium]